MCEAHIPDLFANDLGFLRLLEGTRVFIEVEGVQKAKVVTHEDRVGAWPELDARNWLRQLGEHGAGGGAA